MAAILLIAQLGQSANSASDQILRTGDTASMRFFFAFSRHFELYGDFATIEISPLFSIDAGHFHRGYFSCPDPTRKVLREWTLPPA